jgi:heme/copper-type cytochrome/quinol oxidase subunit 2
MSMRTRQWLGFATFALSVLLLVSVAAQPFDGLRAVPSGVEGQDQGQVREFTVTGDHYAFSPAALEVNRNDLVKINFTARDIPHSLTIDGPYRISKRAGAGQTVTFEFRADQAGTFSFYCNLSQDAKCKEMKGQLVVR